MDGFLIRYEDINSLLWEYKENLEEMINKISTVQDSVRAFVESTGFEGETADAVKGYMEDVHITLLASLKVTAQNLLDNIVCYKAGYYEIDNNTNFVLSEESMGQFRSILSTRCVDTDEYGAVIVKAISDISDLIELQNPEGSRVADVHEQMDSDLIDLSELVSEQEETTVKGLENSSETLISSLNNCIGKAGTNLPDAGRYEPGSFYTDADVYKLAYLSEAFYQHHENNKDVYDEIWKAEEELKVQADARTTEGIWETIGGAALVVAGAACIVVTAGAATPIVVAGGAAVGGGTLMFGLSDTAEGAQDIYYGNMGDIDSEAINGIKDVVFNGNEKYYYITEEVFSFAASALTPIGAASKMGTLTFREGAKTVGKMSVSMAAGWGASEITEDLTGNRTAGAIAGMAVDMATGFGLEKLDFKKSISAGGKSGKSTAGKVISPEVGSGSKAFGEYSTKIDSKVTVVDKQELPSWLVDTYKDGNYRTVVTNEEITVYRSFGYNAEAGGAFATSNPASSRVQTKVDSAILPEWKNTLRYEAEIVIPKGTTLNIGRVGEQYTMSGARLAGDADQFLLPQNWDLNWIKNIREVKP